MTTPRHCMVVHAYYPVGETRVQREAMALIDRGFDVDVICLRDDGEARRERIDGIEIHRLPVARHRDRGMAGQLLEYLTFFVLAAARLTRLHLRRRYHTVQVHNLPDFLVFVAVVPKLTGTPVVLDLHDLMPEFFAARSERGLGSFAARVVALQERLACRFADHVITVTDEWRRTLGRRSVPEERVAVVMNLADPKMFQRRAAMGTASASPGLRVLYHGTFTERYGVDVLVRAVHLAAPDIPGLHLELLGDGDARDDLVALVDRLGVADTVHLSDGMLDAALLPEAISAADVGVVPNRRNVFTDGLLPTKLLEYVAMGTPVVASRTPGVEAYFDDDMVEYFEAGSAEALAEALRTLAREPERRAALAQAADGFNDRFDWESTAADYVDLIASLGAGR